MCIDKPAVPTGGKSNPSITATVDVGTPEICTFLKIESGWVWLVCRFRLFEHGGCGDENIVESGKPRRVNMFHSGAPNN